MDGYAAASAIGDLGAGDVATGDLAAGDLTAVGDAVAGDLAGDTAVGDLAGDAPAGEAPVRGTPVGDTAADGAGTSGGKCSFDPSTGVLMADGTIKPIGKISAGDMVESADPTTGKDAGGRSVRHLWVNHDTDLLDVTVDDGNGRTTVHTTADHPFYDDTTKAFVRADHLVPGDRLASTAGHRATVAAITPTPGVADRYNLTVTELHTYYVVAGGVPILGSQHLWARCD